MTVDRIAAGVTSFVRRPAVVAVGYLTGGLLFGFVLVRAWSGFQAVAASTPISMSLLLAALLMMVAAESFAGVGFAGAVGVYEGRLRAADGVRVHFLTSPSRLLPGLIASTLGRVGVGARLGFDPRALMKGSITEPVVSAIVAAGLGLTFLDQLPEGIAGGRAMDLLIGVLVLLGIVGLLSLWSFTRQPVQTGLPAALGVIGTSVVAYVCTWVLFGASLMAVVAAIGDRGLSLGPSAATFAVAWLFGFLVVFIPGGLGVREGVMTAILAPLLGADTSALVAVLSRVVWWMATATIFLVGVAWSRVSESVAEP